MGAKRKEPNYWPTDLEASLKRMSAHLKVLASIQTRRLGVCCSRSPIQLVANLNVLTHLEVAGEGYTPAKCYGERYVGSRFAG